jgi:hypothetical protein
VENVIEAEQVKIAVNRRSDAGRASNVLLGLLLGEERDYLALLLSFALVAHQGGTGTVRSAARHHVFTAWRPTRWHGQSQSLRRIIAKFLSQ